MIEILIANLIPLYILIVFGFIGGRKLDIHLHSMAMVSMYFISPMVNFGAIWRLEFTPSYLLLPLMVYIVAVSMAFLSWRLARIKWKDDTANLCGMALGGANTGYFGLPLILALFGPDKAGIYLLATFAMTLSENTVCYYIGARGAASVKDSVGKVLRLPAFHAIWAALLLNFLNIEPPKVFLTYWQYFAGSWVVIGMMLIGVALAGVTSFRINWPLVAFMFVMKFAVWPLALGGIIALDVYVLHMFTHEIHIMLLVAGIVPLMANTVAFAARLGVKPGEAATAVLLSTIFALFYIPAVFLILGIEI
jgi:predicted permease